MTDNDDIESQPRRPRRNLHGAKDTEARSLLTSSIDETPAAITGGHTTLISSLTNYFTGNNDDDDDDDDDGSAQAVKPKQSVKSKEEELFEQALDASGFFRCLSDETFAEILDLLDIRSFGRMARTCTRASRITSDLSFLRTKAERGSWSHGRRGVVAHSRDEYRELFRAHLKREKDDARARQTQQLAQHKQKQKQRATTLTALMFAFFWELASVVCIWTVLIRTVVKLDGLYDPSWASVLWPLALPGMQFTFGNFITGTMLYAYSSTGFDLSDIDRRHVCGPFLFGLMYIWPAKNEVAPFATLITLPAGVATLLLLAKIAYYAGNPSFPFLVCAAPVGVQTLLLSAGLLSKKLIPEPYEVDFVFFSIIFLLWGIEALFIAAKLDGLTDQDWYHVFIPLLMIKCVWFAGIIAAPFASICCKDWMRNHATWRTRYGGAWEKCLLALPVTIAVVLPVIVFEVLLVLNLEHARFDTYGVIFAPLFAMTTLLTVLWMGLRIWDSCRR